MNLRPELKETLSDDTAEKLEELDRSQAEEIIEAIGASFLAADLADLDDDLQEMVIEMVQNE